MDRDRRLSLSKPPRPRGLPSILSPLAFGVCGASFVGLAGCSQLPTAAAVSLGRPVVVRAVEADTPAQVRSLPETIQATPSAFASEAKPAPAAPAARALPISLDAVFRLAEEQNPQVALARAKVREASAEKAVAAKAWLPAVYAGTAYYRHEGGIQNEDGTLQHSSFGALFGGLELSARLDPRDVAYQQINAARRVWQQKGELSRINYETLLDAASTYVDLLAVRTGEVLARSTRKQLENLHKRTTTLAESEPAAKVEVVRIEAELRNREQVLAGLRADGQAASAKLAYLLGLEDCTQLVPVDERLVPLELVNAAPPVCDLVAQALASGPGVREMEGLLALVHESMERAKGPGQYLPVVRMRMLQGGFGAGPGSELDWDNRWDLGVQVRWNLTEHLTRRERRRVAQARLDQLHWAQQDLRGKLTLGVQEAREAIHSNREQIRLAEEQVRQSEQAYKLSYEQMRNNIPGVSSGVVQLSLQAQSMAQANLIRAIRAHNRAQLRLLLLLGGSSSGSP